MTGSESSSAGGVDLDERLCVISCDSHVGPSLDELRPYCESRLLPQFDSFAEGTGSHADAPRAGTVQRGEHRERMLANVASSHEQDAHLRLRDMDEDGVAAEVIFHGSQNSNPIPFGYGGRGDRALEAAGARIYNRWLADFCSVAPERRGGLLQVPGWDPAACVEAVRWGREAGLRGVNFPSMRPEDDSWPTYVDPVWEPFWSTCEELDMPLVNHQAADLNIFRDIGPARMALVMTDAAWLARRAMWWLMFGGVFERHPKLKLVITEQPGFWPKYEIDYLDSVFESGNLYEVREGMARRPSEIFATNVYVGGSFLSNSEAHLFLDASLGDRVMWGSDYPHIEGSWPHTRLALRKTFEGVPLESTKRFLSLTAAEVYGFDLDRLDDVVSRIGPTVGEVSEPVDRLPDDVDFSLAFREVGAWH